MIDESKYDWHQVGPSRIVKFRNGYLVFGRRSTWFARWQWLARLLKWFVR